MHDDPRARNNARFMAFQKGRQRINTEGPPVNTLIHSEAADGQPQPESGVNHVMHAGIARHMEANSRNEISGLARINTPSASPVATSAAGCRYGKTYCGRRGRLCYWCQIEAHAKADAAAHPQEAAAILQSPVDKKKPEKIGGIQI